MHSHIVSHFENFFQENLPNFPSFHPYYNEALKEMLKAGGKRFRPYLILTLVNHYAPLLLKNSYFVAAGVEMLHTYSLIHDDLPDMDNSPLRRGKTTLHVKYDPTTAILVGDGLNTHAFYMLSIAPLDDEVKVKLIKSLAQNGGAGGMVLGQAIDCQFEKQKISLDDLKFLHTNKTAKLIASCLQMGAIISNLDTKEVQKWYDFGLKLGLLFQIQDDIIDVIGDEKSEGKPIGLDEYKNSFTNALGLDGAKKEKEKIIEELNLFLENLDEPLKIEFKTILEKYFKKG